MNRSDKLKKIINSFTRLNFDEKVEFIKVMLNSIKLKEAGVGYISYDTRKKIEDAKKMLEYISSKLKNKNAKPQIASILPEIDDLTDEQLTKLVVTIVDTVHGYTAKNELSTKKEQCKREGHIFSDWEEKRYTTYISPAEAFGIEGLMNGGKEPTIPCEVVEWYRTCERCGYVEVTKKKPQEVEEREKEAKRQARIREIKKELKDLEKNKN